MARLSLIIDSWHNGASFLMAAIYFIFEEFRFPFPPFPLRRASLPPPRGCRSSLLFIVRIFMHSAFTSQFLYLMDLVPQSSLNTSWDCCLSLPSFALFPFSLAGLTTSPILLFAPPPLFLPATPPFPRSSPATAPAPPRSPRRSGSCDLLSCLFYLESGCCAGLCSCPFCFVALFSAVSRV